MLQRLNADGNSCSIGTTINTNTNLDESADVENNFMLGDDRKTVRFPSLTPQNYSVRTVPFLHFSDIDEYENDPDDDQDQLCPGMCRNTIGSYVCVDPDEEPVTCQTGLEFHDEDGHCKGE